MSLESVVKDVREFWKKYEEPVYSVGINPKTGKHYIHDARRAFTKYWLADIAGFYIMYTNRIMADMLKVHYSFFYKEF